MKKIINKIIDRTLQLLSLSACNQLADNWPDRILQFILLTILAAVAAFISAVIVMGSHLLVGPVAPLVIVMLGKTGIEALFYRGV